MKKNKREREKDEEELRAIVELTNHLLVALQTESDPIVAMQSLSSAVTFVLCHGVKTRSEVDGVFDLFVMAVKEAINTADRYGLATWSQGTRH